MTIKAGSLLRGASALALALTLGCGDDGAGSDSAASDGDSSVTDASATDPSATDAMTTMGPASGTETGDMTTSGPTTDPSATDPSATDPSATDPSATDPSTTDPSTTDATDTTDTGVMTTSTTGEPDPVCGNGILEMGEECDDGDNVDNNACSNMCQKVPCDQQEGNQDNLLSYIWIANSSQGTVSKINTQTATEEARYYVEGGNPSRTSVNLFGDVAVSSRDPGGVTKIIAQEENCIDKNQNGMIETSQGPGDLLPLGTDECVAWQKPVPSPGYTFGPRATAWVAGDQDPDSCQYPPPVLWVAWKDGGNTAHFLLVDGETGDTLEEILHPWGSSFSPYGGAVDADGNFYATGLNTMPSVKIDFQTLQVTDLGNPNGCKYGMTLDLNGDIWAGACFGEGVYHWDHMNNQWTTLPNSGGTRVNGIMADADGNVWGAGSSNCRLVHIDVETKTYVNNNIPLPGCSNPWGVSIDFEGYVWVVDMSAAVAFKVDPDTYQVVATVGGLVGPYTYSDMTGVALKNQLIPQ